MNQRMIHLLLSICLIWSPLQGFACSSFLLPYVDGAVLSKSYDWHLKHGIMIVNARNMKKESLSLKPGDNTHSWVSKYGSLTFNQYGREFPLGGVNEKGLMIEVLWLAESTYPGPDQKPSANELQWIQYMLDNAADLNGVKDLSKNLRVSPVTANVHYMVCDQTKNCSVFEYIDRKLVVNSTPRILAPTITNNTYSDSENYLKNFLGFGGTRSLPKGSGSLARFVRASSLAKNFDKEDQKLLEATEYAKGILDDVASGSYSKWNIVYDFKRNKVIMKNRFGARAEKLVHPQDFDYSCKNQVQVLRIDTDLSGEVQNEFQNYERSENERIVKMAVGREFPPWLIEQIIDYPTTHTECIE